MVIIYISLIIEEVVTAFIQYNRAIYGFLDFINQSCRFGLKIPLTYSVLFPLSSIFPLFLFTDTFLPRDCFFWASLLIFPTHIWCRLLGLTCVHEKQWHFCPSFGIGRDCVINSSQWTVGERCVSLMGRGSEKFVDNSPGFLSSPHQLGSSKFRIL